MLKFRVMPQHNYRCCDHNRFDGNWIIDHDNDHDNDVQNELNQKFRYIFNANRAAASSASFFDLPEPVPQHSPSINTSTVKTLR